MILVVVIVLIGLLCFLYKKYPKTAYTTAVILAIVVGFLLFGLWTLDIEDRYGEHNSIYFDSKVNDTVVMINKTTGRFIAKGQVYRKSWNKVFIEAKGEGIDLNKWIDQQAGYMTDVQCALKSTK